MFDNDKIDCLIDSKMIVIDRVWKLCIDTCGCVIFGVILPECFGFWKGINGLIDEILLELSSIGVWVEVLYVLLCDMMEFISTTKYIQIE